VYITGADWTNNSAASFKVFKNLGAKFNIRLFVEFGCPSLRVFGADNLGSGHYYLDAGLQFLNTV